jgi:hypothetical protein
MRGRQGEPGAAPERSAASRAAALAAGIAGGGSLAVYLATLAPTVLTGNDAELVAAAHVLGIAHPTGYPLYLLAAKLFELLPLATPPMRVALLSAVSGAGAAAAIAWATARLARSGPAGVLAGLIAALSGELWSQATMAEVYALNALLVAGAIAASVRWSERRRPRDLVWLALVTGLGLAHHLSALFFTGPLLIGVLVVQRPSARELGKAALAGAAPLLSYVYLPARAAARPPIMWSDVSGWGSFVWHVTGRSFSQAYAFARPWVEVRAVAGELAGDALSQVTIGGLALAAVGLYVTMRRHRALGACLLVGFLGLTIWNLWYLVPDWSVFFIPCFLVGGLWAGVGLGAVARAAEKLAGRRARWAPPAVAAAAVIVIGANLVQFNWPKGNHRGDWRRYDESRAVLEQIEDGGVYVTDWDAAIFWYLQVVEGMRPDVDVISATGINMRPLDDEELAGAVAELTEKHIVPASQAGVEAQRMAAAPLAKGLAKAIEWRRPVYCGVDVRDPPDDPRMQYLWWNLFRMRRRAPDTLVEIEGLMEARDYGDGIALAGAAVRPVRARPGEPLRVTLDWRCAEAVERPRFVLVNLSPPGSVGHAEQARMLLSYGTWLVYGRSPLPRTPEGYAYRQEVTAVVPTTGPAGRWEVRVGVASAPERGVPVETVTEFEVAAPGASGP